GARLNLITGHATVGLELPNFPLGEVLPVVAEKFAPQLAPHLGKLTATAAIKADLTYMPEATPAWRHDVRIEIKDGKLDHPDLPGPVDKIAVKLRSTDGKLKIEEATAKLGPASVKVALETRSQESGVRSQESGVRSPAATDQLAQLEE